MRIAIFVAKTLTFLFLVVFLQWFLVKFDKNVYWNEIPVEVQSFKDNVLLGKDVFFFGDSVSFFSGKDDDKRTIPDFLQSSMSGQLVAPVTHSAYHADIFKDYVDRLPNGKDCPAIVIELNLRSFSEAWEKRPEYQYEKEKIFLANSDSGWFRNLWKPLSVFKFFKLETFSQEEFRATPIIRGGRKIGTMQDFFDLEKQRQTEALRKVAFNYSYLYDLSEKNSKVQSLVAIAKKRKTCAAPTIIYVSPVDYQSGEGYWGKTFTEKIKKNVSVIKKALKKENVDVLDWSTLYSSNAFMWRETNFPDEHLHVFFRRDIGEGIATILKSREASGARF